MNACYFIEPTGMKTRWQVLQSTNARMKEMLFEVRGSYLHFITNAQSDRVQGYIGKFFVTFNSCSCLPTRKTGTHCVDVGSGLKNVVQVGLVFDVVLYLPNISRSRCLMNKEILQKFQKSC